MKLFCLPDFQEGIFYCRKVFLKLRCTKDPSNSKQVRGVCKVTAFLPSTHRELRIFLKL